MEGTLTCKKCKESFSITKGIPRFVKDKTKNFVKTEDAFSAKWRLHHENHQAQDWIDFQQKWFFERYGWKSHKQFSDFLKDKHTILDAGSGIGNSAKMLSVNPNSQVFALDAS